MDTVDEVAALIRPRVELAQRAESVLRHGDVTSNNASAYLFLFSNCLVLAEPLGRDGKHQEIMHAATSGLSVVPGSDPVLFTLYVNGKVFEISVDSPEERNDWVATIQGASSNGMPDVEVRPLVAPMSPASASQALSGPPLYDSTFGTGRETEMQEFSSLPKPVSMPQPSSSGDAFVPIPVAGSAAEAPLPQGRVTIHPTYRSWLHRPPGHAVYSAVFPDQLDHRIVTPAEFEHVLSTLNSFVGGASTSSASPARNICRAVCLFIYILVSVVALLFLLAAGAPAALTLSIFAMKFVVVIVRVISLTAARSSATGDGEGLGGGSWEENMDLIADHLLGLNNGMYLHRPVRWRAEEGLESGTYPQIFLDCDNSVIGRPDADRMLIRRF